MLLTLIDGLPSRPLPRSLAIHIALSLTMRVLLLLLMPMLSKFLLSRLILQTSVSSIPVRITNRRQAIFGYTCNSPLKNNFISVQTIAPTPGLKPAKFCLLNVRSLANKSFICQDFISTNKIDFFIVTESWINPDDCSPLIESSPPDYLFFHQPRLTGRGGGLAVVHRNDFSCSRLSLGQFTTFESLGFILKNRLPILCVLIYRPPKFISGFIQEFSDFLSDIILKHDRVLIVGDFNIHVCCPTSSLASEFINLLQSFNLTQSVKQPSHVKGHTLDLVLSHGFSVDDVNIVLQYLNTTQCFSQFHPSALILNPPL